MSLSDWTDAAVTAALTEQLAWEATDRQINQLLYYRPVSERAAQVHASRATILGISGGNRSSKTETALVDLVICATGLIPESLRGLFPVEKLRGPVEIRIISESLTMTMHQVMLAKLDWRHWEGTDAPGGVQGHWGWIPKDCLVEGDWDKSWSEKYRTLKVLYRNPDRWDEVQGISRIQFNSFDQHPSDFESGQFHHVFMDEPPSYAIWKANRARVMAVGGRLLLAMTWPDNPAWPVEWIFDEVYERGVPGPKKEPHIEWHTLITTENRFINQEAVAQMAAGMSRLERLTRIEGQPIRFAHRIHPLLTDQASWWCFPCGEEIHPIQEGICPTCEGREVTEYCHVMPCSPNPSWPAVYLLDPHPRKPHMMLWVQVDPNDDWWVLHEQEIQDDPLAVKLACDEYERSAKLQVPLRLIDPNMGRSPSSSRRGITWQDEFETVGLFCDLADDSDVGRARLNDRLKPDPHLKRPRLHLAESCVWAVHQLKRYRWMDTTKQKPIPEHDDYPTLLKYLANADPVFSLLKAGWAPVRWATEPGPRGY